MAVGVNIVSQFDAKGITKAVKDFKSLQGAGNKATFGLRTLDSATTNAMKNVAKYGGLLAAGLGAVALNFVKGAEFAKQADDRLAAVNRTMGLFGTQTDAVTKRLIELADKGEYKYGILAESIKDTQSKLLTFKNIAQEADITGGLFDRATIAALDLQAAGFGEATQNAVQLGKALQDPIKGITALARSGVTFTDQEKEKIKTLVESGKMYEAQKVLLEAIEGQVSGTAEATSTATFRIASAFGHVRDELGTLLLPLFERFAKFMVEKVVPYASEFGRVVGEEGIGAGMKMLAGTFFDATAKMGAFGNTILALIAAFTALKLISIAATISQTAFNTALLANPIGIAVAAIIAFGVAVAALYIKFEGVRKVVNYVINWIIGAIENWLNVWVKVINGIIDGINIMRKVANFFGADMEMLGHIGEVQFGRIGTAAASARKQMGGVAEVAGAMAAKEGGVGQMITQLKIAKTSFEDVEQSSGGAAKTIETAKEKLKKYIDAAKGATDAQRGLRDAQKATIKANTDLVAANAKLADAQAYFNRIISGYGSNSDEARDSQKKLTKAQRDLEKAGYDVESAIFAVKNAEKELADLRKDPEATPQMIREAEIKLAEAKLSVADATDSQTEATLAVDEAQKNLNETVNGATESSDIYKEALDKLNEAKAAQVETTDRVTEAIERERDAVDKLREAEEKLAEVRAKTPVGVVVAAEQIISGQTPTTGTTATNGTTAPKVRFNPFTNEIYPFAKGGIVTSPMVGLVGEAGNEAIIPLDRLSSGMTVNVTINAGMGVDPAVVGDEIVNVLQRYNRRNGALPLKVA